MKTCPWFGNGEKPFVTFVRGPIVSTLQAMNNEAVPSISLAYLSAYIEKHGYAFTWVDAIADGMERFWPLEDFPGYQCQGLTFDEILARIPQETDVIAVNSMFSGEWPVTRMLIRTISERFPDAFIVAGGEHITALTEFSLRDCSEIDACIRGEGESALVQLLDALAEGVVPESVPGIAFLDDEGGYRENTGVTRIRDIDSIPWPHWPEGYLEQFWAKGKSAGVSSGRDMPMMISRGCPYRCAFCSNENMWTTRYILRDVGDVIAEIKTYIERYDISSVQLYDLTAITKRRWAVDFCQRLIDEKIDLNWSVPQGTRSETLDREILSLFKRTGCHYLVYAPESGSERMLERIKKKVTLSKLVASVMEAHRQGIVLRINLIIGFPGERRSDVLRTAMFGLSMASRGVDEVSVNIFSPYPGSALFRELVGQGNLDVTDEYFLKLTSLNSDFGAMNPLAVNEIMSDRELAIYRIVLLLTCYFISYAFYPWRIVRTIRNWRSGKASATVFEHRFRDFVLRRLPFRNTSS